MKTPREKADELVDKFENYVEDRDFFGDNVEYKNKVKCAIIVVDEIIILAGRPDLFKMRTKQQHMLKSKVDETYVEYWQEVKNELEKML